MTKKLVTSYTFSASGKTITTADFTSLEKIQLITNVTSNVIIYSFADPAKGGSLSGTTLTLAYSTSSMSNTDKLQIFVDDGSLISVGVGSTDSGTQRVVLASDSRQLQLSASGNIIGAVTTDQTTHGTTDLVAADNTKIAGTAVSVGAGVVNAGTQRVTLNNEQVQDLYLTGQSLQTAIVNNIIPASSGTAATDVTGYRSASIQVVSTGTAGTFIFEGSNDNTSFQTIPVYNQLILTGTPIVAAVTATSSNFIYVFPLNVRYVRLRIVTAITGGSIQAFATFKQTSYAPAIMQIAQGTAANLNANISTIASVVPGTAATSLGKAEDAASVSGDTGVFTLGVRRDAATVSASATGDYNEIATDKFGALLTKPIFTHKRTYSASMAVTPVASATDIVQIIGSATTTVMIQRIIISGTLTTAAMVKFLLIKRSTANTGGTSAAASLVPHDSGDAAATTVVSNYSANPSTLGTAVGTLRQQNIYLSSSAGPSNPVIFEFADKGKPIVLSGVAQALAINLGSITLTGGALNIDIEFTEE